MTEVVGYVTSVEFSHDLNIVHSILEGGDIHMTELIGRLTFVGVSHDLSIAYFVVH